MSTGGCEKRSRQPSGIGDPSSGASKTATPILSGGADAHALANEKAAATTAARRSRITHSIIRHGVEFGVKLLVAAPGWRRDRQRARRRFLTPFSFGSD